MTSKPNICKLLEGILKDKIFMHLERPGLIRDNLHGLVQRKLGLVKPIKDFEEVNK